MSFLESSLPMSRRGVLAGGVGSLLSIAAADRLAKADDVAAKNALRAPSAEHLVLFWCAGGLSHVDSWDPKTGRPSQGEFAAIPTSASGVEITQIFPLLAKQMHHAALIRSLVGVTPDHVRATHHLQTSYEMTPDVVRPGLCSVVAHEKPSAVDVPSFIALGGQPLGASYLGPRCEPTLLARTSDVAKHERLAACNLDRVPAETIRRYGDNEFGRSCLLAKRLIEAGVRCVQIHRNGFDMHAQIFPSLRRQAEQLDPAWSALLADLAESGLLSKTLVLVLSEFGRTPKINKAAGRDHHAPVFSCLLAGGGTQGGQVIGSSDADGAQPKSRPVTVSDLHATVCHALRIDGTKEVPIPNGKLARLIDGGQPVRELFGKT